VAEPVAAPHARQVDRRARLAEAPPAPWSPFPLIEICILIGIILIVIAFAGGGSRQGALLGFGFSLISLSAIELSVREHFAGFRSHTTLLSAVCALAVCVPLFLLTGLPQGAILVAGGVVFALAVGVLRGAFARRAGGLGFRA
jgi:hypothetical protein